MALGPERNTLLESWARVGPVPWPTNLVEMETTAGGVLLPGRYALAEFFDDFNAFTVAASNVTGWHQDAQGSPTDAAVQDAAGGVVLMKPGSTGGNNVHYHWATSTTVNEVFKMTAGKRAWLTARFKVEDADQNLPIIGAHVTQDDPWNTEPADQFVFRTLAADPDALQLACGKTNSTEVTISLGNLADDTWVRVLGFYDGADTLWAARYDDSGNYVTSGSAAVTSSTQGDLLPDTELAPAFGVEAVDAGADDFSIDYLYLATER